MATYVDRVLEPGESVRYRTTVSWIVYIPSGVLAAIALAALLVAGSSFEILRTIDAPLKLRSTVTAG